MTPRASSTPYAVLGLLSLEPMSGYDIRNAAATSIGHFWSESFGQIYPALADLRARGLIRRLPGGRAGGRERQVYEITERGRRALREWRAVPPRAEPVRNELLLKLFFGDRDSRAHDADSVSQLLARERARLAEFRRIRERVTHEHRGHPGLPHWMITLSYGEHRSRANVRWCRETLRVLGGGRTADARRRNRDD